MSVNVFNFDAHYWSKNTAQGTPRLMESARNVSIQTLNQLMSDVLVEPR